MSEVREGYKMTELGEIPSDWEVKKIRDISTTISGGTPNRSNKFFYENGSIPWIKTGELKEKYINQVDEFITDAAVKASSAKFIEENSIVVAMYGATIGQLSILPFKATTNQACCSISVNKENSHEYLYYYLKANKDRLINLSAGGAQPNISQEIIKNFSIVQPPKQEQQKIASILSTVDEQIDETEQLIVKTKELKKGLMQQLLTKGIGHTEFKQTELGEIPVDWEVVSLGDLANIHRGASPRPIKDPKWFSNKSSHGWIRISDVTKSKKYLFETEQYLSEKGIKKSRTVVPGDLIMSICGTIGRPIILKMNACIHDGFVAFECLKKDIVDTEFLRYSLTTLIDYFKSQGQPGTQVNLNTSIVEKALIALPALMEQQKIASILSTVDAQIEVYEEEKAKYEELKKGLMQKLLTGQIRVKC